MREFTAALLDRLATRPGDAVLVVGDREVTGEALARRLDDLVAGFDLPERALVVLEGGNDEGFVTTYLALLVAGHVPLLTGRHGAELAAEWGADALVRSVDGEVTVSRRRGDHADLHPDLALLLSTSGSTGSPRLVRLSQANLAANARSIAQSLGVTPADRAITTLPLHYCYGLSVLHSHLLAGASVVIADVSVVDPCCWRAVRRHGVTNLAGVPHSFELLERAGIDPFDEPSIRFLTQAGGRMDPARVRRWAHDAAQRGRELFVMYGQTEATARMAVLPPSLAAVCPSAVGRPIAGGSFELRPHDACDRPGVGEIVYRGPNVMMGYATEREHLADGAQLAELATGDLGRYDPDLDVYEVVGRVSRFVKPFGVRIDLGVVERTLAASGLEAVVDGDDAGVAVLIVDGDAATARSAVMELTGLPLTAVAVAADVEVPRTSSGKVDGTEVRRLARTAGGDASAVGVDERETVSDVYRSVLGVAAVAPADTFVGLGGDSLSYIECSVRLESVLGTMPADWHLRPVAELERSPRDRRPRLETTIVIRAIAICAIVATHMQIIRLPGGAHVLLAVAGYNLARFQLTLDDTMARIKSGLRTAARVAVPTSVWVAANLIIGGTSTLAAAMLVSNWTAPGALRDTRWRYWFVEAFVALVVIVTLLLAISSVRRLERRWPFGFPALLLLPCLVFRFPWWDTSSDPSYVYRTYAVAFFFMLGWMAMQASRTWQRVLVSVLALVLVPGYFGLVQRDVVVMIGLLVLVWVPAVPVPRRLHQPASALAAASMWIYLSHYQVWRPLAGFVPRIPLFVLTLVVGVYLWRGVTALQRKWSTRQRHDGVAEDRGVPLDVVHGVVRRHQGHVVEGRQQDAPVDGPQVHEGVEVMVDRGRRRSAVARRRAEPVLGATTELLHRPRQPEVVDGGLHARGPRGGHRHHDREVGLA